MSPHPSILHIVVASLVIQLCRPLSAFIAKKRSTAFHCAHTPHTFDAIKARIPEDEVNRWLVQKGFEFDSYRRRFDFGGSWKRDSTRSVGVVDYLQAHGLSPDEATRESERPYVVNFERERITADGIVFRMIVDGGRRSTTYRLGEWTEIVPPNFNSALFEDGEQLQRKTYWNGAEHITETTTAGGSKDTTTRYLEGSDLIVHRTLQKIDGNYLTCKECFVPSFQNGTSEVLQSRFARVPGCVANVDVRTTLVGSDFRVYLDGEADAMVSRGIMAVFHEAVKDLTAEEVLALDPAAVADNLGLRTTLSPGRNDGLASLTKTVQSQIDDLIKCDTKVAPATNGQAVPRSSQGTVAMLLSGGVDSSVALNQLKRQGYNVTAFYLKIWLEDELAHLGQCPWEDDYRMCEQVCAQAEVPLEAISLQEQYKEKVIAYTVNEAERGRTPNPDIMCNSMVKFGCFYDAIAARGFDFVASGHYAQLVFEDGKKKLLRAPDPVKDQSYFLCALTQEQLGKVIFPIGHLQKAAVRELADEFDLPNKNRPDSQGLCFLGKVKFDEFLAAYLGERPGDIVDAATGEHLGRHKGVWYHTVGQRKGIGKVLDPHASHRGPWYVVSKDPANDIVYLSNEYDEDSFTKARTNVFVEDIHWIDGTPPSVLFDDVGNFIPGRFEMKIRHGPRLVGGTITLEDNTGGTVVLDKKDGGLAPGQFVVFYDDIHCLGGGVISERHWTASRIE